MIAPNLTEKEKDVLFAVAVKGEAHGYLLLQELAPISWGSLSKRLYKLVEHGLLDSREDTSHPRYRRVYFLAGGVDLVNEVIRLSEEWLEARSK